MDNIGRLCALCLPLCLLLVVGCGKPPPPPAGKVLTARAEVEIPGPPPQFKEEAVPAPPKGGGSWMPGYWHYDGEHFVWVDGRWVADKAGQELVPPQYLQKKDMWLYIPPSWKKSDASKPAG